MSVTRLIRPIIAVAFAVGFAVPGTPAAQTKKPEPTITLTTRPTPPVSGQTTFTVTAKDAAGKPITGADVTVELVMPPMGAMAEMKNKVTLKPAADPKVAAEGTYTGTGQILMGGKWNVTVDVKVGNKSVADKKLTITAK